MPFEVLAPVGEASALGAVFDTAETMLTNVINWVGTVITEITGSNGALHAFLPFILVPFAMMILVFGIKSIRKLAK